jgi:hypothetical protein
LGEVQRQKVTGTGMVWDFILARSSRLKICNTWPAVMQWDWEG